MIERLLAATPLPPPGGCEELLAAFERMFAARTAILAEVRGPLTLTADERDQLAEIEQRDALWQQALAAAKRAIAEQRIGVARLRAYAGP